MPCEFTVVAVAKQGTISEALASQGVTVKAGDALLYSVQKSEVVSAGKKVLLVKAGAKDPKPVTGAAAREAVGLPPAGSSTVKPASVPAGHTLYVQSTSSNRRMPAGSSVAVLHSEQEGSSAPSVLRRPASQLDEDEGAQGSPSAPAAKRAKTTAASPGSKATASAATPGKWQKSDSVYVRDYGSTSSKTVAGYDMDSTLIETKSGKTFPQSKDDWKLWNEAVPGKLQELHKSGHKIVILTNQGGVAKGQTKLADIQAKIDELQAALDVPLLAMILTQDDLYRKPLPAAWKLMESEFNGGVKVTRGKSFYCGDAAGREPPVVKKKDFSANDLKFALNLGVDFYTPEEHFLGLVQKYEKAHFAFDPRKLGVKPAAYPVPALKGQTLVLCIGPPGSGKSSAATQHFTACVRVNQDTLKTKEKCLKACEQALKEGKSVIVDNQNKQVTDRAPYLALAKAVGAASIAIHYDVPKELCFHLNAYRMLNTSSELHRPEKVPSMVIHGFYKNVQAPKVSEGFSSVYRVGLEHFAVAAKDANLDLLRSFID
eukprot:CAMPEP_0178396230 /NCGR_PEP_ID=MMETSP0689_2-20121128/13624_1 /TAXON_ID=160604 /ORGANISM="Amphidinium massartii, Strain CS-259" /LENGTH=542 /DNA_ID=CAMNT_0020016903 /DNA_START=39 /DNA_END=1667 /DNA_ORIENTATION=+